jgi:hypothetical protein
MVFAEPTYWYIATSADQAFTSTFIARLVLHLRSVASLPSTTTYTDASTLHVFSGTTATSIGRKIATPIAEQDQERYTPEQHLDAQQLKRKHGHDEESMPGGHSIGGDQWRHRKGNAVEMDVRGKKKEPVGI